MDLTPLVLEGSHVRLEPMLGHAFETRGCIRVELKTDVLNDVSRRAIERIGGVQACILRQHMVVADGRLRESVYFSILDREWAR